MNNGNINEGIEQHGGNISRMAQLYPRVRQPWIDLSTGINPYSYPLPPIDVAWLHRLSDPAQLQAATASAAIYYRAASPGNVVLASGMQPLMFALASLRYKQYGPTRVRVIFPSYTEHARIWQSMGHAVTPSGTITNDADVLILCNPNNPDGKTIPGAELIAIANNLATHHGWLIVDESFMDLTPEHSVVSAIDACPNIIVLRSCGKFFGVAGLRVSAAIASAEISEFLRIAAGPWPISTAACQVLPAMLADVAWSSSMRVQLEKEAMRWRALLSHYFSIVGHCALFTLVETDHAKRWHQRLGEQGIIVRQFDYNKRWLRFGLPEAGQWERVQNALMI